MLINSLSFVVTVVTDDDDDDDLNRVHKNDASYSFEVSASKLSSITVAVVALAE